MDLDREVCYRAMLTRDARFDGRFFIAVKTTGVYCRPVCPARPPKLEHVVFLPSAAAAQSAGFRSCLRCRPERSPELAPWHGTPEAVSRAMALIASGVLDDGSVRELAARLGVGERQLRRLFRQHIGATPNAVAQTRRLLFAKQLISDTRLTSTQVAFAAGYGSVRRFNDVIRKVYGRSPQDLRRADHDEEPGSSAISLTLPFKAPYDWPTVMRFLAGRAIPGVETVENGRYARTISIGGEHGFIAIERAKREAENSIVATIRFPTITALPTIVSRIRSIFDLGADPIAIDSYLSGDPTLRSRIAPRPGLRVPGAWDAFELAVRAILGQQVSVTAASRLAGKLVAAYGTPIEAFESDAMSLRFIFPTPTRLATAELAATIGMPAARARAISSLAAAAAADPLLFDSSRGLDAAIARLTAIPGIGEWTAQYIAMRALREPDAFPAADIGLLRALATNGKRPTPKELLDRAAAWRPWRAYAALYLWTADPTLDPVVSVAAAEHAEHNEAVA